MPVWHQATRQFVEQGKLVVLGITQEQHPQRCRLFAQWHAIGWPILHDPINLMQSRAVPLLVAIDQHGVVRDVRPSPSSFATSFMDQAFDQPAEEAAPPRLPETSDVTLLGRRARAEDTARSWRQYGDALVLWGERRQISEAIAAYGRCVQLAPSDGHALFRLGVAYRMRYESAARRPSDFQAAVDHWSRALALDPNQYIWRRRIQQYGPRLQKPYPFYDWVKQAESDIRRRGETPIALAVPPTGAEIARPARQFTHADPPAEPDPQGQIMRDVRQAIRAEVTVVPARIRPASTARVHLTFWPTSGAQWNNEAEPLRLWIEPPSGWHVEPRLLSTPPVKSPESNEVRRLELEIQAPGDAQGGYTIPAYALYYVCEQSGGQCLYLRQDLSITCHVE